MAAQSSPKKEKPIHADHRARMRTRVEKYGLDSLAEHEALEYILFYALPRRDTNPVAHALLNRFGSFAGVLDATREELEAIPGIGPAAAEFLCTLRETNRYYLLSQTKPRRRLADAQQTMEYLLPLFQGLRREKLVMLALDERRRLLRTVWLDDGTAGSVEVSVRRIAAEAVSAGAANVILAHNHPDGVALPSRDDLLSTAEVIRALALLEIRVLDHIILAGGECLSLHDSGRMPGCDPATGRMTYI